MLGFVMPFRRGIVIALCIVAAGCGTTTRRVSVESSPSWLRPWQRPYTVDGERYVPLLSAEGFREEGLASWYGSEEHGKPTSNGETFDMYAFTAAHKTLPLGSCIRVTNRANNRQTIVRVNDRGPFVRGRIVDLSYRGASELGIVDGGITPVIVETVASGCGGSAPLPEPLRRDTVYTLQVAACSDRSVALSLPDRLKKDYPLSEVRPVLNEKGLFFRVQIGGFRTRADAEIARAAMSRTGFPDAFIVTK
jgi:rare lipoprotein A